MSNSRANYLTDSEIEAFIKNYIDKSSYNYAILIDGNWGCGKTFFTQNTLIPYLEYIEKSKKSSNREYKERKIIYISLYGIKTKDEITKQIVIESIPFKNKSIQIASNFGKAIIGGLLSYKGIQIPEIDLNVFLPLQDCNTYL